MARDCFKTVKGHNLQSVYVDVDVDGLTLGDFLAFNQELNKMVDPALPFKIHPEHFVFAGVHGGQEVMEMVGQYGEPTYQKLIIHPDAEKPVAVDPDTKLAMVGDGVLMSDQKSGHDDVRDAPIQNEKRRSSHQTRCLLPRFSTTRNGPRTPRTSRSRVFQFPNHCLSK